MFIDSPRKGGYLSRAREERGTDRDGEHGGGEGRVHGGAGGDGTRIHPPAPGGGTALLMGHPASPALRGRRPPRDHLPPPPPRAEEGSRGQRSRTASGNPTGTPHVLGLLPDVLRGRAWTHDVGRRAPRSQLRKEEALRRPVSTDVIYCNFFFYQKGFKTVV